MHVGNEVIEESELPPEKKASEGDQTNWKKLQNNMIKNMSRNIIGKFKM